MNKKQLTRNLIIKNSIFISSDLHKNTDLRNIKEIVKILNKDKRIIISGIDFGGKTNTIKNLIEKTNTKNKTIYFNKKLDTENIIKNDNDLKEYIRLAINKNIKIIILQNIGFIENIKNFLKELLDTNYNIIIVGNDIEIENIEKLEVKIYNPNYTKRSLKYGNIGFLNNYDDIKLQKEYISLIREKIFLDNIFNLKSVKDINLYNSTITFLSKINNYYSTRELHSIFSKQENISIKTFTDYIEYSEQSKIIKKVDIYDLNRNKEINRKSRYFFLDNGILNSLNDFRQNGTLLIENLIFIQLYLCKIQIFGGRAGKYNFDFYIKGENDTRYAIKISDENNIKKDINKLKKLKCDKKYIIIKDLKYTNIRKKDYVDLQIIDLWDFFELNF